jgi:hypothetical protein
MLGLLSYKSLGPMQQSRELLQQLLAAVPYCVLLSGLYVVKSSEDGTIFRRALPLTSASVHKLRWIEIELRLKPALALLRRSGCFGVCFPRELCCDKNTAKHRKRNA